MSLGAVCQQSQAACQGVQDLILVAEDTLRQTDAKQLWIGPEGDDRMSELDTG